MSKQKLIKYEMRSLARYQSWSSHSCFFFYVRCSGIESFASLSREFLSLSPCIVFRLLSFHWHERCARLTAFVSSLVWFHISIFSLFSSGRPFRKVHNILLLGERENAPSESIFSFFTSRRGVNESFSCAWSERSARTWRLELRRT